MLFPLQYSCWRNLCMWTRLNKLARAASGNEIRLSPKERKIEKMREREREREIKKERSLPRNATTEKFIPVWLLDVIADDEVKEWL